jgi:hypothetical protein
MKKWRNKCYTMEKFVSQNEREKKKREKPFLFCPSLWVTPPPLSLPSLRS